jgi:hypothetical protein
MSDRHLLSLVSLLLCAGAAIFLHKWLVLGFPVLPGEHSGDAWRIDMRVELEAHGGPLMFATVVPESRDKLRVVERASVPAGFSVLHTRDAAGLAMIVWASGDAHGTVTLRYHAEVSPGPPVLAFAPAVALPDTATALAAGGEPPAIAAPVLTAATGDAHSLSTPAPPRAGELPPPWVGVEPLGRIEVETEPERSMLVPPWVGVEPLGRIEGATLRSKLLSVAGPAAAVPAAAAAETPGSWLARLSLHSVPTDAQPLFQLLMLIPVGTLVIVVLRQMVGLHTFGTFMPVLVALGFREMGLLTGLLLCALLIATGLALRWYLERFKLLFVSRLAAVLVVVVLLLALTSVALEALGLGLRLSVALFPVVILSMVIERMSQVWEEHGRAAALREAFGSTLAAALAYQAMNLWPVDHLVFTFPELLLVLLAAILLAGRYTGLRLLELWRFRALAWETR